jgi:hypothetical protein
MRGRSPPPALPKTAAVAGVQLRGEWWLKSYDMAGSTIKVESMMFPVIVAAYSPTAMNFTCISS